MRISFINSKLLLSTLTLLTHLTTAQQPPQPLLPTTLPPCSPQCTSLQNAQTLCLPPKAQLTNPQTYKTCFCQSAYLTPLQNGITGLCDQVCDTGSLTAIRNWFLGFCASGDGGTTTSTVGAENKPSITETVASATSRDTTIPASATVGSTTSNDAATETNAPKGGWWSTHWNWVLFLILLLILSIIFSIGGVWIKRRYKRRQAAKTHFQNPDTTITTTTTTNNNNNISGIEAGLGSSSSGGGGPTSTSKITKGRHPPPRQEMLQNKEEWGPLTPSHHTGFKEGYGKEKRKSVTFNEVEQITQAPESNNNASDGHVIQETGNVVVGKEFVGQETEETVKGEKKSDKIRKKGILARGRRKI
ncbi:MAG: hypothetical protein M1812_005777 [Candelaria pacifica]|nr:MAG: hypothetical protein M1812_005777 [Candelaria pacifica]